MKHGESSGGRETPEYSAWKQMRMRCFNKNNPRFDHYGGRGITVCAGWTHDFSVFLEDMGRRPTPRHSLERKNNDGNYEPDNCAWALPHSQMTNRSCTRFVEVDGDKIPLATLAKKYGIPANTLRARILSGWDLKRALTDPVRTKLPNGLGPLNF